MDSPPIPLGLIKLLLLGTGVCLYFKESLPIKERCDLEILPKTILKEIKLNRKKVFIVVFRVCGIYETIGKNL